MQIWEDKFKDDVKFCYAILYNSFCKRKSEIWQYAILICDSVQFILETQIWYFVDQKVPVNGDSVVADYDLKLGNIDVDLDGLGPLQVKIKDKIRDKIKD